MTESFWEVPEFAGTRNVPHGPPENVIGAPVGANVVLVRSDDVAVSVEHLTAFPNGLAFLLVLKVREGWSNRWATSAADALMPRIRGEGWRPRGIDPGRLRFGVAFSDGRKATNLWADNLRSGGSGGGIYMSDLGGHGSASEGVSRMWLQPLPPPGRVMFACQWPARNIPFTRRELDAQVILEAARNAIVLWPGSRSGPPPSAALETN